MRCPECNLENEAHVTQCVECGADLTQAILLESIPHRTNQVWNTDIDADRNRKNSRTALMVLGVTAALVIALVVAVALYLPNVISYSMDSFDFSLPDIHWSDLFEPRREAEMTVPAPEPDYPPADRLRGADFDFINVLTAYAIELSYAEDADMQREIHQMFYPELEYLCGQEFEFNQLYEFTWWVMDLNRILSDPESDGVDYMVAMRELSTVVLTLNESFYFLSDFPYELDYYANLQVYTEAMLEVEYSLQFQLVGAATQWSKEHGCQVVYYTNDTPYTLDFTVTNDFVTDTEHYSESHSYGWVEPGVTIAIPLEALKEIGDKDHTWHLNWEVETLYLDGEPLEPWDIVVHEAMGVWGYS